MAMIKPTDDMAEAHQTGPWLGLPGALGAVPVGLLLFLSGCAEIGTPAQPDLHAEMEETDINFARSTLQSAMETAAPGQSETWQNPETGMSGQITAGRAVVTGEGFVCRRFTDRLAQDDRSAETALTACRDSNGIWQVIP